MRATLIKRLAIGAGLLFASQVASAAITGSAHDLSGTGGVTEVCIFCHAPHNNNTAVPLWNHTLSTATYTVYGNSATLNATVGQPAGVSKLCLSCHDGTVAVDSFGTRTGTAGTIGSGSENLGTDLGNDHPISFTYNAALATADGTLHNPATRTVTVGTSTGTVAAKMLYGAANDQVECASCHDVHRQYSLSNLLKISNTGSAMCFACHNK